MFARLTQSRSSAAPGLLLATTVLLLAACTGTMKQSPASPDKYVVADEAAGNSEQPNSASGRGVQHFVGRK